MRHKQIQINDYDGKNRHTFRDQGLQQEGIGLALFPHLHARYRRVPPEGLAKALRPAQGSVGGQRLQQAHEVFHPTSSGTHREVSGGSVIGIIYSHMPSRNADRGKIKSQFFPHTMFPISNLNFLNLRSSK